MININSKPGTGNILKKTSSIPLVTKPDKTTVVKMRRLFLFFIFLTLGFTLLSCGDEARGSKDHILVSNISDSIKVLQEQSQSIVLEIQKIKIKVEEFSKELEQPDSLVAQLIFLLNEDIADSEGVVKKNEVLISQHEEYIEAHENSALSVNKIKLQHEQIKSDYSDIQNDLFFLKQRLDKVKNEASKYIDLEEGLVIYHKK